MRWFGRRLDWWVSLAVLLLALVVRIEEPGLVTRIRAGVFDTYQRWQPREYRPAPVRIVDIDEESLAKLGQWPWPRTLVGRLVARLRDMGAAVVAFDIIFAEPDRTATAWVAPPEDAGAGPIETADRVTVHDAELAEVIASTRVVTGFSLLQAPNRGTAPLVKAGFAFSGDDPKLLLAPLDGAVPNLAVLEAAASGNGALNLRVDRDGIARRVPLLLRHKDNLYPTLSAEALRVAQGATTYVVKPAAPTQAGKARSRLGIGTVRVGALTVPTTADGSVLVHYARPVPDRYIPAWQVLEGTVAPQAVRGMIVLVGTSATGLMDLQSTPLDPVAPGVEVHAQVLEQMINQQWLLRPGWADGAELLFLALLGLAVIVLSARLGAILAAAVGGVGLALAGGLSWYAYAEAQLLLDPFFPSLTVGVVYVCSSLVRHVQVERQRKFVEHAFSSYLSPNLVQYFIDNPDELRLGGERRECSFVLTDLAGFTSLVERSDPALLVSVLNDYIDGMTSIAFAHEGTLDRIVGDAVAVLFSAPIVQADHAQRAVACALAMDQFAEDFARAKRAEGIPLGHTRIGVNTGPVVIGNVGGKAHSDYRALGDAINTAARLETANRQFGTRILVSGATVAACAGFTGSPVGALMLKGKTDAVDAYVPYSPIEAASTGAADYAEAFALLDRDVDAAAAAFSDLARRWPEDPLVAFHLGRLRNGERGSVIMLDEK